MRRSAFGTSIGIALAHSERELLPETARREIAVDDELVASTHPPGGPSWVTPVALFLGFGASALEFELRAWTNRLDRHVVVRSELGVAVYGALREAGFSIPFPQQEIRIHPAPPPESGGR